MRRSAKIPSPVLVSGIAESRTLTQRSTLYAMKTLQVRVVKGPLLFIRPKLVEKAPRLPVEAEFTVLGGEVV